MADDAWKKLGVCPRCSKAKIETTVSCKPIGKHFMDCICGKCGNQWSVYSCMLPG